MNTNTTRLGIILCLISMLIFSIQDAITKTLVQNMEVAQFIMFRYWAFLLFAFIWLYKSGKLTSAFHTKKPIIQIIRSTICIAEIAIFNLSLRYLGLAEAHALLAAFPLIAIALASPLLGEKVGILKWIAVLMGFIGTLIVIRPGLEVFKPEALIALAAAVCFAFYNILTRLVSMAGDSFHTNMLYMALIGFILSSLFGIFQWREPSATEWVLMIALSITGVSGHLLLVKALEYAPAAILQPFNYSMLVFATIIGIVIFSEIPDSMTIFGSIIIASSGIYAIYISNRGHLKH